MSRGMRQNTVSNAEEMNEGNRSAGSKADWGRGLLLAER